jgi:hypothetical protein
MTANLITAYPNIDEAIRSASNNGQWRLLFATTNPGAATAANTTSGYVTASRLSNTITVPSVGAGFSGYVITMLDILSRHNDNATFAILEYTLGTLAVATNTFTDGSTMPTKTVRGSSLQTGSMLAWLVATAALTATTPAVTITYKNEEGTGSRTATLTLPTNAALGSAFFINPHLQAGDTGIQDVTNMSKSAGTAGTLKVYGGLVLGCALNGNSTNGQHGWLDPLVAPMPNILLEANDTIAFYECGFGSANADTIVSLAAVPE